MRNCRVGGADSLYLKKQARLCADAGRKAPQCCQIIALSGLSRRGNYQKAITGSVRSTESILFRRVDFPGGGPNIDQCVVVFFFAEHRIGSWKVCDGEWEEGELHEMTWGRKRLGWSESWTRSAKRFGGGGAKRSESILGRVAQ